MEKRRCRHCKVLPLMMRFEDVLERAMWVIVGAFIGGLFSAFLLDHSRLQERRIRHLQNEAKAARIEHSIHETRLRTTKLEAKLAVRERDKGW